MRAHMLGAHGRDVQKGIGEAHMFLLTRASGAEPNIDRSIRPISHHQLNVTCKHRLKSAIQVEHF